MPRGTLLLLVVGFCLGVTSGVPVRNPPRGQVDGIVGESVSLRLLIHPEEDVANIEWDFQPESDLVVYAIAEFTKGTLERPNPGDQFQQRLAMPDETTLRIKGLVKEDSGVYTAHVRLKSAEIQEQTFFLVVSDKSEPSNWWWKLLLMVSFIILMSYFLIWLLKDPIKLLLKEIRPLFRR